MKAINLTTLLVIPVLTVAFVSCKKEIQQEYNDTLFNAAQRTAMERPLKNCLLTQVEDDLLNKSFDFHYNNAQDPESVSFCSSCKPVAVFNYDHSGRISQIFYKGNSGNIIRRQDFVYQKNSTLPGRCMEYMPATSSPARADHLVNTIDLSFNDKGQIVSSTLQSEKDGAVTTDTYVYVGDNVTTVYRSESAPAKQPKSNFIVYSASRYDNKKNFVSNPWVKLFLWLPTAGMQPYNFSIYSNNNAVDWTYTNAAQSLAVTSHIEYNPFGFATNIKMHLVSKGNDHAYQGDFNRKNNSSCDELNSQSNEQPVSQRGLITPAAE